MQMRCVYTSIHKLLLSSIQHMIMSQNHLQTLLKILTLSFLFFLIKSNANEIDKNCASQTCNGLTIGYPFWRLNNNATSNFSSQHCGYQGFGVNCSSTNPIFYLNREAYDIKSISYQNHNFTLVDNDFENQTCPRAPHNISLGQLPLSYSTSDLNLSFHLNCGPLTSDIAPLPVPCLDVGTNRSYMTVGTVLFFEDCAEKIVSTVIQSQINLYDVTTDFGRAMGLGFSLDWNPTAECRRCEASKGRCGYDSAVDRFLCYCSDGVTNSGQCKGSHASSLDLKIGIGLGAAVIGLLLCCFMITYTTNTVMFIWTWRTINDENVEAFILQCGTSSPKRYTYSDIKKMTNSFKHELGRGGYGNVYKGSLKDGHLVAVKVLNPLKGNGEEFMNEVASIGRTSHVNIVKLLGFCYEGRRRALIYDFMPNGSLDTFIYAHIGKGDHEQLGVENLYEIALGIARGLEYLHHGCNTRILHLDIKPQNILLDDNFCPKVADFGLAKLYTKEESIMSMLEARGTIGYIAPEVFNKSFGGVSHKSDVYSYGMLIMEIIGGRCSVDLESVHTSDTYFPHLVYKCIEKNEELQLQGPMSPEGNEVAKKMTLVGLWCIQTNPSQRPSMKKVIEMLEGRLEDLEIPPKPFLSSPPRSEASSFTSSVSL